MCEVLELRKHNSNDKSKYSMKIIFLDIDGVLNTCRWEELCLAENVDLEDRFGITFDKISITNLKTIIDSTHAAIVIHSTWKLQHNVEWFVEMWKARKLPGMIYSVTPSIAPYYNKQEEVAMWLRQHPYTSQYVILDDEKEFDGSLSEHHVLINGIYGITTSDAEKAIQLLL